MAQDMMVREREGTGVILIFKIGQGGPLWSPSASTRALAEAPSARTVRINWCIVFLWVAAERT